MKTITTKGIEAMAQYTQSSDDAQKQQQRDRYTKGYVVGSKAPVGYTHNYGCFDTIWGQGFRDAQKTKAAWLK